MHRIYPGIILLFVALSFACGNGGNNIPNTDNGGIDVTPDTSTDTGPQSCVEDSDCPDSMITSGGCVIPSCVAGTCVLGPAEQGTVCDDGDNCTEGETCTAGSCVGPPKDCDDDDPCTDNTCDDGTCIYLPNDDPCDDNNPCTVNDTCSFAGCGGIPRDCDDGNSCTEDACDADPISGGCIHTANTTICDDDNLCTESDVCVNKICVGQDVDCDDGSPCTADSCDPELGCVHTVVLNTCDDGQGCTVGDTCEYGLCQPGDWNSLCNVPTCGNRVCDEGESCVNCEQDCGHCCGDGICTEEQGENCLSCGTDCGSCSDCGDEICASEFGEDCDTCPTDCGACDDVCLSAETVQCGSLVTGNLSDESTTDTIESYSCAAVESLNHAGGERTFSFTPNCSGLTTVQVVRTGGAGGLLNVMILDGTQPCRGDSCIHAGRMDTPEPTGGQAIAEFYAQSNHPYRIVVDGGVGATGNFKLAVSCPCGIPPEDCADGVDNDLDGKSDCTDPDCYEVVGCETSEFQCFNFTDDDLDGLTDCADPDCASDETCIDAICPDGLPLGCGDSLNGFLGALSSVDKWDAYTCQEGSYQGSEQVFRVTPDCDGTVTLSWSRSDDGGGSIDVFVFDNALSCDVAGTCLTAGLENEETDSGTVTFEAAIGSSRVAVVDGRDGLIGDFTISATCNCEGLATELCQNGFDDDGDEAVDCADPDCASHTACSPENCADNVDDNNNYLIDCLDPVCDTSGSCLSPGEACTLDDAPALAPGLFTGSTIGHTDDFSALADSCGPGAPAIAADTPDAFHLIASDSDGRFRVKVRPTGVAGATQPSIAVVDTCPPANGYWCLGASNEASGLLVDMVAGIPLGVVVDGGGAGSQSGVDYELTIEPAERNCTDGLDGDGDGFADCSDVDCVGDTEACPTEGDFCLGPNLVTALPYSDTGNTMYSTPTTDSAAGSCPEPSNTVGGGSPDVFYLFSPPNDGLYEFSLTPGLGGGFDSVLYIRDGCPGVCYAGADVSGLGGESIQLPLLAGETRSVVVDGFGNLTSNAGVYQLNIRQVEDDCTDDVDNDEDGLSDCADPDCTGTFTCPTPGDQCINAIVIDPASMPVTLTGDTTIASPNYELPSFSCEGQPAKRGSVSPELTYSFTPDFSGLYQFRLDSNNTNFNTTLYAVTDCDDIENTCLAGDDDSPGNGGEAVMIAIEAGETIYLIVDGWSFDGAIGPVSGTFTLHGNFLGPAEVNCSNGSDDDADGSIDCTDTDCAGVGLCPIVGLSCASPIVVSTDGSAVAVLGTTFTGQDQFSYTPAQSCPGLDSSTGNGAPDAKIRFISSKSGIYRAELDPLGTEFDSAIYIKESCANGASCLAGGDVNGLGGEIVDFTLEANQEVFIVVDGSANGLAVQGTYLLRVELIQQLESDCGDGFDNDGDGFFDCGDPDCQALGGCPKVGDVCEDAISLSIPPTNMAGTTSDATPQEQLVEDCGELAAGLGSAGQDVSYEYTVEETGQYLVVLPAAATNFDSVLYVTSSCGGTCLGAANVPGGSGEELLLDLSVGELVRITVDGAAADQAGDYVLGLFYLGPP